MPRRCPRARECIHIFDAFKTMCDCPHCLSQGGRNGSLVFVEFEPVVDSDDVSQSRHPAVTARHSDRVDHSPFSFSSSSSSSSSSSLSSSLRASPFRLSTPSGVNRSHDQHSRHHTFGCTVEVGIVDYHSSETYDNAAAGDSALAAFGSRRRSDRDDDDDANIDDGGGNRYDGGTNDISAGGSGSSGGGGGGLLGWLRWLIGAKDAIANGANGTDSSGME